MGRNKKPAVFAAVWFVSLVTLGTFIYFARDCSVHVVNHYSDAGVSSSDGP